MDELIKALPLLLRAAGDNEEVAEAAAFVAWRHVAGEGLRYHAIPFRLYRRTLIVAVPDATWRRQIEKISGQLIFRLNSLLGQPIVTYIEFRVDPQTVQRERARRQRISYFVDEERALRRAEGLRVAAGKIRDEALRRRFLLAAGSCLDRMERSEKIDE